MLRNSVLFLEANVMSLTLFIFLFEDYCYYCYY